MKTVIETRKRTVTKKVTNELNGIRELLSKFPKGILSVVSDTFDLFKVITEYLPRLKEEILSRDGKLVIRPDSGDPVDIVCGSGNITDFGSKVETLEELVNWAKDYLEDEVSSNTDHGQRGNMKNSGLFKFDGKIYKITIEIGWNRYDKQYYFIEESKVKSCVEYSLTPSEKGVIELLWDVFGGTINDQGYKVLDPHIGAIYGDSITLERADKICKRLESKGFYLTKVEEQFNEDTQQWEPIKYY